MYKAEHESIPTFPHPTPKPPTGGLFLPHDPRWSKSVTSTRYYMNLKFISSNVLEISKYMELQTPIV